MNPELIAPADKRTSLAQETLCDKIQREKYTYGSYWTVLARLGDYETQNPAMQNQRRQVALTKRLYNPGSKTGVKYVDERLSRPVDVAEEWYLNLGSMNSLQFDDHDDPAGLDKAMLVCFARFWSGATGQAGVLPPETKPQQVFREAVNEVSGPFSEVLYGVAQSEVRNEKPGDEKLKYALLAGNLLLDRIRAIPPEQRDSKSIAYLQIAAKLNDHIADGLSSALETTSSFDVDPRVKRVYSDAVKFKYEAKYEILLTKWKIGELDEESYERAMTALILEQTNQTIKMSGNISNGDLNEHYSNILLRYFTVVWHGDTRYTVNASTRRQDEPRDGFVASRQLPSFAIDATVIDTQGAENDRFIQLKAGFKGGNKYGDGIVVIDDIIEDASNAQIRTEISTGLVEIRDLTREALTGDRYPGDAVTVARHAQVLNDRLNLE